MKNKPMYHFWLQFTFLPQYRFLYSIGFFKGIPYIVTGFAYL